MTLYYDSNQQNFDAHLDVLDAFMQKCVEMPWDCWLQTSFGPSNIYAVTFNGQYYTLYEWRSYGSRRMRIARGTFIKRSDLVILLIKYPSIYAQNVYSGQLCHWTNWIEFLKAFKLHQWKYETSMTA